MAEQGFRKAQVGGSTPLIGSSILPQFTVSKIRPAVCAENFLKRSEKEFSSVYAKDGFGLHTCRLPGNESMLNLTRHKNISLLWISQLLSQCGDRIAQMCLIGYAYQKAPGSSVTLAIVTSATLIPAFLISPFAGAYIDRWNKKFSILSSELVRAFFIALIPFFLLTLDHNFAYVYAAIFTSFASACFLLPARLAAIPELVAPESLVITNSFFNSTTALTIIIGFLFGGFIVEFGGLKMGFYITALFFVLAAAVISFLNPRQYIAIEEGLSLYKQYVAVSDAGIRPSIFKEIKEGLVHLFSEKNTLLVARFVVVTMLGVGALYVLAVVFIQEKLHSVTKHLGVMALFLGIGFIAGNVVYARIARTFDKSRLVYGGIAILGIVAVLFVILLSFIPMIYLALILMMIAGAVLGPILVTINTIIHEDIAMRMQGRIFSLIGVLMNITVAVSLFLGAWLGKLLSVTMGLVCIGIALFLYGAYHVYRRHYDA